MARLEDQGVCVPPGFCLSVRFFQAWFDQLEQTPEWDAFLATATVLADSNNSDTSNLEDVCNAVKLRCEELQLVPEQTGALERALAKLAEGLRKNGNGGDATTTNSEQSFVAVRSSSPEEDLGGASFAGGYETVLGVEAQLPSVAAAVRQVFISCLDERIVVYKLRALGNISDDSAADEGAGEQKAAVGGQARLHFLRPRMAVVVQAQVAATVAGVAFSLHPLTGCRDTCVVDANYGLGESVVSGVCSPDSYAVDTVAAAVTQRQAGAKRRRVVMTAGGGTQEVVRQHDDPSLCLSDAQLLRLAAGLAVLQRFYGHPVDTEFAFEGDRLYWLQSRPITTAYPLHPDLATARPPPGTAWQPGQRRLFADITQVVQGLSQPLSVAGGDLFHRALPLVLRMVLGLPAEAGSRLVVCVEGRMLVNLGCLMATAGWDGAALAALVSNMDTNTGKALAETDMSAYASPAMFTGRAAPKLLRTRPTFVCHLARAYLAPHSALTSCQQAVAAELQRFNTLREQPDSTVDVSQLPTVMCDALDAALSSSIPCLAVSRRIIADLAHMFAACPQHIRDAAQQIQQGLPGNVTVSIALLVNDLALALLADDAPLHPPSAVEALWAALQRGEGPPACQPLWTSLMQQYGHRGEREIDVASPRYREHSGLLQEAVMYAGMIAEARAEGREAAMTPHAVHARAVASREAAHATITQYLTQADGDAMAAVAAGEGCGPWLWGVAHLRLAARGRALARYHELYQGLMLGGQRETHKYLVVLSVDFIRSQLLRLGEQLVGCGRLDAVSHVFNFTFQDLAQASAEPQLDLRCLMDHRLAFRRSVPPNARAPSLFDSRGRILRATPPPAEPGQLVGAPISSGVCEGRVKVLASPKEKPVLPGEVLVAWATEPSWTPLFVPAGAIVLEVGGALQHGALVAREYGKPCVAGVTDATTRLRDGMRVRVDGGTGRITILDEQDADDGKDDGDDAAADPAAAAITAQQERGNEGEQMAGGGGSKHGDDIDGEQKHQEAPQQRMPSTE